MLRLLVLTLVLLNGLYYAWSHQLLRAYGYGPAQQSEPERLTQQIRPDALVILSTGQAPQADSAAQITGPPATCLQAGLFDDAQSAALRLAAQTALPVDAWTLEEVVEPARWIVYMGRYPDSQTLARKRAELAALDLRIEPVANPALAYGFSLGGFSTEARANAELAALVKRGVRTAQVVQERAQSRANLFRIPLADDAMRARLEEIKPALNGKPLRPCA